MKYKSGDVILVKFPFTNLLELQDNNIRESKLSLKSYIKYDRCFTITTNIVEKQIAKVNTKLLNKLKNFSVKNYFNSQFSTILTTLRFLLLI